MKKFVNSFLFLLFVVATAAAATPQKIIEISSKNDQLVFDKTSLSAKAGQHIKLIFKNKASKNSGLQHNWVLVKPGTADEIANSSLTAGVGKDWIADSPNIISHTKLVNAGDTDTIEFTAPPSGTYPYLCTFPGHAQTMKGTLIVN